MMWARQLLLSGSVKHNSHEFNLISEILSEVNPPSLLCKGRAITTQDKKAAEHQILSMQ